MKTNIEAVELHTMCQQECWFELHNAERCGYLLLGCGEERKIMKEDNWAWSPSPRLVILVYTHKPI